MTSGASAAAQRWRDRPAAAADMPRLHALEVRCHSHPWTLGNFTDSLAAGHEIWLREDMDGTLVGHVVVQPGVGESHLLDLAVEPSCRRRGHGRGLLALALERAHARGDACMWLEVRAGNDAARTLYLACGWRDVATRRGYYVAPRGREDALVMRRDAAPPQPTGTPSGEGVAVASAGRADGWAMAGAPGR